MTGREQLPPAGGWGEQEPLTIVHDDVLLCLVAVPPLDQEWQRNGKSLPGRGTCDPSERIKGWHGVRWSCSFPPPSGHPLLLFLWFLHSPSAPVAFPYTPSFISYFDLKPNLVDRALNFSAI